MKIPVSNKRFIEVHEDTTLAGNCLVMENEDTTYEIREGELVALFNLINLIYPKRLTLEECLVYLDWDSEIEELAKKSTHINY